MAFAENLKEKRAQSGLTQAELAMKAGVTARTIQNYELGTRKPGNMVIVQRIADALGTTTEQLLSSGETLVVAAHERGGPKVQNVYLPQSLAISIADVLQVQQFLRAVAEQLIAYFLFWGIKIIRNLRTGGLAGTGFCRTAGAGFLNVAGTCGGGFTGTLRGFG